MLHYINRTIPLNGFGTDKINSPLHSLWQSFHNILSRKSADCSLKTAASATQCRSNPVSGRSLPKTGVFQMSAGDYRLFRSENAENWSLETAGQFAKARHWRAFLPVSGTFSLGAALPGWRRSAHRAGLHANSLLTGNFTGKFAISRC